MPSTSIFNYKSFKGRLMPLITIGLKVEGKWYPLEVYVDSGSFYSLFQAKIAEGIGFNYKRGKRELLRVGDGGLISAYLHDLEVQLGEDRFMAQVGFSDKLGVGFNLLGRVSVFEKFKICFEEGKKIISFELV